MIAALPFFAPTWGSNPVLGNGMIAITVILAVAASVLLLKWDKGTGPLSNQY